MHHWWTVASAGGVVWQGAGMSGMGLPNLLDPAFGDVTQWQDSWSWLKLVMSERQEKRLQILFDWEEKVMKFFFSERRGETTIFVGG